MTVAWKPPLLIQSYWQEVQQLRARYWPYQACHPFRLFYLSWKSDKWFCIRELLQAKLQPNRGLGIPIAARVSLCGLLRIELFRNYYIKSLSPLLSVWYRRAVYILKGRVSLKKVTADISQALDTGGYHYMIRTDIKSYYASINHRLLKKAITDTYDDPRIIHYLKAMVDAPIDRGGWHETSSKGILRKCTLAPLFAALYLKSLDTCFDQRRDMFYRRYNDDTIILCKTKRQYARAKRSLNNTLNQRKLQVAPKKTYRGAIEKTFHFLGLNFFVAQTQRQPAVNMEKDKQSKVSLHPRSVCRALKKIKQIIAFNEGSFDHKLETKEPLQVNTVREVQRYVMRWARWWAGMHEELMVEDLCDMIYQHVKLV